MTPQHWKAMLPFVKAFAEGKTIQQRTQLGNWVTLENPEFTGNPNTYRIAPKTVKTRRYWWNAGPEGLKIGLTFENHPAGFPGNWDKFIKWIDEDWVEHELPTTAETVK